MLARRLRRDQLLDHVPAHALWIALERIAPPATAAGAHEDFRTRGHWAMAAVHRSEFTFSRPAQVIAADFAGHSAPKTPRRTAVPPRALEVPLTVDEITDSHIDAEAAAISARTTRVLPQCARL